MKKFLTVFLASLFALVCFSQHTITIELATDQYGTETTWEVRDILTNQVLAEGGPYSNLSSSGITVQSIDPIEVDGAGCYVFTIWDAYGDGICCAYGAGYFRVYYDEVLVGEGGNFQHEANVAGMGSCPADEISLSNLTIIEIGAPLVNIDITGRVRNLGTENLTSYKLRYKIDDNDFVSYDEITCNVESFGYHSFTHSIPVNLDAGFYEITVEVSEPNGIEDITDNNTMIFALNVPDPESAVQMVPLFERFTATWCPSCGPYNTNTLKPFLFPSGRIDNITYITYYSAESGGSYYCAQSIARANFYDDLIGGYPTQLINAKGYSTPGYVVTSAQLLQGYNEAMSTSAFISLSASHSANGTTISGSIDYLSNIQGSFKLRLAFVDISNNDYILKHMYPGVAGEAIDFIIGEDGTYSYEVTVPGVTVNQMQNIKVMAFVQNDNSKSIYQSIVSDLSTDIPVTYLSRHYHIYPNPVKDILTIANLNNAVVKIFNAMGQIVYENLNGGQTHNIDVATLPTGTYFINIIDNNEVYNEKILIVK